MSALTKMRSLLEEWGMIGYRAPRVGDGRSLRLTLTTPSQQELVVGRLSLRDERFFFEYSDQFKESQLPPLLGLPDVDRRYESETLFPFFQHRLPPEGRADVAQLLAERAVDRGDVIEKLKTLGHKSATSPYVLDAES